MVDKMYKCLNPVGIQKPIDLYPLAPRLDKDKLTGKTIYISVGAGGEQGLMILCPSDSRNSIPISIGNLLMPHPTARSPAVSLFPKRK